MKIQNFALFFFLLLLSGCADGVSVDECLPGDPYGFWGGLWHGLIVGFSFIGSLFSDDIVIYSVNNTGGWYDFGFMFGSGLLGRILGGYNK